MAKWASLLKTQSLAIGERRKPATGLHIADNLRTQAPVYVTDDDLSKHTHIIGGSGSGKSILLYKLALQLIHSNAGGIIIDPHSSLYSQILTYTATQDLGERIIFFSPFDESTHTIGYSPIPKDFRDDEVNNIASSIVLAILKVYNQQPQELPRTTRMLYDVILPIVQNRLSLLETEFFLLPEYQEQRSHLLKNVKDKWVVSDWMEYEKLPIAKKVEYIEPALNRLRPILTNPHLRLMLGNTQHSLDFDGIVKAGKVVVVSLKGGEKAQPEEANLIGALLLNTVYQTAIKRDPEDKTLIPFRVIVDEFQNLICDFIVSYFYEIRKFAVSFICAHQSLSQLEKNPESGLVSAMANNCSNKIVFRLGYDDSFRMAHQILIQDVNLLTPKFTEWTEKQRPYQSMTKILTESYSKSESSSFTKGESQGSNSSTSEGRTEKFLLSGSDTENNLSRTTDQTGQSSSTTISESRGHTTTTGQSASYAPITLHETYFEGKTTYYSLQDCIHISVASLMKQQTAECTIKLSQKEAVRAKVVFTKVPEFNQFITPLILKSFWQTLIQQHSQYYQPRESVEKQIARRREQILNFTITTPASIAPEPENKGLFSPQELRAKKARSVFSKTVED